MTFGKMGMAVVPNLLEINSKQIHSDDMGFGNSFVPDRIGIVTEENFLICRVHFLNEGEIESFFDLL